MSKAKDEAARAHDRIDDLLRRVVELERAKERRSDAAKRGAETKRLNKEAQ